MPSRQFTHKGETILESCFEGVIDKIDTALNPLNFPSDEDEEEPEFIRINSNVLLIGSPRNEE